MLFLLYLVGLYNIVKEIYKIKLILIIIGKSNVPAKELNEPFGYLVSSLPYQFVW